MDDLDYLKNFNVPFFYDSFSLQTKIYNIFDKIKKIFRRTKHGECHRITDWNWEEGLTITLTLHTNGWNECQDIIYALSENKLFWSKYWESTEIEGKGIIVEFKYKEMKNE